MASSGRRDWRYGLNSHPFCKKLHETNSKEKTKSPQNISKGLIAVRDGGLYVWDLHSSHLVHLNLLLLASNGGQKNDNVDRTNHFQILTCNPNINFNVERIIFNRTGQNLAIWGQVGITIMQMPQKRGKNALFDGGKDIIITRTFPLAERLFASHGDLHLLQVAWHPGSHYDGHITFLTSDNVIRISNICEPEKIFQEIFLGNYSIPPVRHSLYSVILGDSAVSFDFGSPVEVLSRPKSVANKKIHLVWPIYVLQGNGDIVLVYSDITTKNPQSYKLIGPLSVHPPAEDNYGTDACSILCLQSTPPVVVLATCEGKLHHYIILSDRNNKPASPNATTLDDSNGSTDLQDSSSAISIDAYDQKSLFVYESVELELSLSNFSPDNTDPLEDDYTCPIRLEKDPSCEDRYHCVHAAGIHTVALPWLMHYEKFCNDDEEEQVPDLSPYEKCIVEHIVCTKPFSSSPPFPVLGLGVTTNHLLGKNLIALTNDLEFLTISLSEHYRLPSLLNNTLQSTVNTFGSPLKEVSKEPFDQQLAKILQRTISTPLLKSSKTMNMSQEECYTLLIRSTKVFREQYIQKQDLAIEEIKRRMNMLHTQKTHQLSELNELEQSRNMVKDSSQALAEKYESSKEKQDQLLNRLKVLVRKVQCRLPILSDAERDMMKELKNMDIELDSLRKKFKETQRKKQYQEHQISVHETVCPHPVLNRQNLIQIKDILKDQSNEITDMVKSVKNMKIDTLS